MQGFLLSNGIQDDQTDFGYYLTSFLHSPWVQGYMSKAQRLNLDYQYFNYTFNVTSFICY